MKMSDNPFIAAVPMLFQPPKQMQVGYRNLLPDGHSTKEVAAPNAVPVPAKHRAAGNGGKWSSITLSPSQSGLPHLETHPSKMSP